MSLDSDGIITLTPSKPVTDADWYFSDEIIVADDAKDYCSNLPGAWRTPTTLETSTEIAKLESMNENVKRFMDSGELAQQVTAVAYFNSDGLKIGIINKDHTIQQWIHSDPFAASNFIHGLCIQQ
ncbi:hypothetical protein CK911_01255 [Aeromonas sp. CU5]|nr:hypothetical protein CK911_01255 [Aeromonas sp. CU5]